MSPKQVRLRRRAQQELLGAVEWYQGHDAALSAAFVDEVQALIRRIAELPHQFPVVHRAAIRRALLRQFPYAMYFKIERDDVIVLAILHQRRDHSGLPQK